MTLTSRPPPPPSPPYQVGLADNSVELWALTPWGQGHGEPGGAARGPAPAQPPEATAGQGRPGEPGPARPLEPPASKGSGWALRRLAVVACSERMVLYSMRLLVVPPPTPRAQLSAPLPGAAGQGMAEQGPTVWVAAGEKTAGRGAPR